MEAKSALKESTLGVNVFTAPGKVMAGERPKPFGEALGFDPITSTLIFGEYEDTKRYLQDFDRLQKAATSDQELFDQMTELYPHWVANQSWLMFGFPQRR
jgi:hypothetical protein